MLMPLIAASRDALAEAANGGTGREGGSVLPANAHLGADAPGRFSFKPAAAGALGVADLGHHITPCFVQSLILCLVWQHHFHLNPGELSSNFHVSLHM